MLVTNDSAPLHLGDARSARRSWRSSARRCRRSGSAREARRTGSRGARGLACRPCSAHGPAVCPLGHHRCMRELSVETVVGGGGRPSQDVEDRACDSSSALTSAGPTSSSAAWPRTGRACIAARERADPRRGGPERRGGPAGRAWPSGRIAETRREVARTPRSSASASARPGPLDTKQRHRPAHAQPRLGQPAAPPDHRATGSGLPPTLDNDANCAVLGEWWVGAARGVAARHRHHHRHRHRRRASSSTAGSTTARRTCAGEIGHTTIDTEGRRCKCGNYGCLEAYASGPNIALRAVEAIEAGAESRLARAGGR